jgi:hypothetical protein
MQANRLREGLIRRQLDPPALIALRHGLPGSAPVCREMGKAAFLGELGGGFIIMGWPV